MDNHIASLLPVRYRQIGGSEVNAIGGRTVHSYLDVGRDFSNWMKDQIERARLVEHRDFEVYAEKGENTQGGRSRTEYMLSLDAAKHICMMSGTERGYEAREYFIEAEKELQSHRQTLNPANLSRLQLLEMAIQSEQERLALECKVAEIEPKAMALDRLETRAEGSLCPTNAAKALQVKPHWLIGYLSQNQWIYKRAGNKNWIAYQDRLQSGLLEHKVTTVERTDGTEKVCEQVLITAKGLAKLAKAIQGEVA